MTDRTVVGSGPARRPLPLGREAVERALRLCKFWREDMPLHAAMRAETSGRQPCDTYGEPSDWLPSQLGRESPGHLRERLRGYP